MRYLIPIVLLLAGCATPVLQVADTADGKCRTAHAVFAAYADCIHDAVADEPALNTGPDADLTYQYLAGVRVIQAEVEQGKGTDAEGFLASSVLYSRLKQVYLDRSAVAFEQRQRQSEHLGAMGLGLMQLGAPRTVGPAPRPSITCTQQGAFMHCF